VSVRRERSGPEWVTFAGCCVVLLVLIATVVAQLRGPQAPPSPVATISAPPLQDGGRYRVEVTVKNQGDMTAANVQVAASLTIGDKDVTGDQTVQFLAGGEDQELVFYFRDDPGRGVLTVDVTGFASP
jgi:uncharacterized protein (TIGR02588 family)